MEIEESLLTLNEYSRPGISLTTVKGIVVHWTANPNTDARSNRNFFESRKSGEAGYGSAHYIICLSGQVIECIPEEEMAYHVGSSLPYKNGSNQIYTPEAWQRLNTRDENKQPYPNDCTIGIECCVLDMDGTMTQATYDTLLELSVLLLRKYALRSEHLWLHKEVVGWKDCHRFFVNNPAEWALLKNKADALLDGAANVEYKGDDKVEPWQMEMGMKALQALQPYKQADGTAVIDYDVWKDKLGEPIQGWLLFVLIQRVMEINKDGSKMQ